MKHRTAAVRPAEVASPRVADAGIQGGVRRRFDGKTLDAAMRLARLLDSAPRTGDGRPTFETLELRRMLSGSGELPFRLDFDAPAGGLADRDGLGVGFRHVQQNRLGNAYQPSLIRLDTAAGLLRLTTTGNSVSGGNARADNTLVNALETSFDGRTGKFEVSARIAGGLGIFNDRYEQGGIYLGYDQDNFVKLVVMMHDSGPRLEFIDEWLNPSNDFYSTASNPRVFVGNWNNHQAIDLRIVADASTGTLEAWYKLDAGTWQQHPTKITVPAEKRSRVFAADSRAGVMQFHKNDLGGITVAYDYFEIAARNDASVAMPRATSMRPAGGETGVRRDAFVAVDTFLPNGAIDASTVSGASVWLFRTDTGQLVPAQVSVSGGGDAITLTPLGLLAADTHYTFVLSEGVKDVTGTAFERFTGGFRTGSSVAASLPQVAFDRQVLASTVGIGWTGIEFGPDGRLYGVTQDGDLWRLNLAADGTIASQARLFSFQDATGVRRLVTGIAFDKAAWQQGQLVAYVSHGYYVNPAVESDRNAPDWTGTITRFSGNNLQNRLDVIVGLPRSVYDHLNNQPVFGPDGRLYFSVASNTAMGAPDSTWGNRPERLLSGAILAADVRSITATLDVKTADGGTYNPYAPGAKVTIYATGVRNAYDLVWHSSGHLLAPANGSAAGGNTPAGPGVPALNNVRQTLNDYLFNVVPGGYYGHPNPLRNEFVLNGGNPTAGPDPSQIDAYPVGITPPANYKGFAYDFGLNVSPNGAVEYNSHGRHFGGALDGKILVARYSGGNDVLFLDVDPATGNVRQAFSGSVGVTGFIDPLDVVQDPATGNLYVIEAGFRSGQGANGLRMSLLTPVAQQGKAAVTSDRLVPQFGDVLHLSAVVGNASIAHRVTITNTGTGLLALPADALTMTGSQSVRFRITNGPSTPTLLAPGQSVTFDVTFHPTAKGVVSAELVVKTNDPDRPTRTFALRGIGATGTGGDHEPSLQRILDLYQIPVRTGDPNPDLTVYPSQTFVSGSEEVVLQTLKKAGSGPVTIHLLASYGTANNNGKPNTSALGWYAPGSHGSVNPLFTISKTFAQTVQPKHAGTLSFDPSGEFALAGTFFDFNDRRVYTQDALNTWESNPDERRKVRFFPLKDSAGSVVENAYVFAFEEWDVATDQNDIVGIIYNVTRVAASAADGLTLVNAHQIPFHDRLVFSRIRDLDNRVHNGESLANKVHDTGRLTLRNDTSSPMTITALTLSNADFQITAGQVGSGGLTLQPGQSHVIDLKFVYNHASDRGAKVREALLTIFSNDPARPARQVQLSGLWQSHSENGNTGTSQEPNLNEIVQTLGYLIDVGPMLGRDKDTGQNTDGRVEAVGQETISAYWERFDNSKPVEVIQIGAWHQQGYTYGTPIFKTDVAVQWHARGSSSRQMLARHHHLYGQSMLPPSDKGDVLTRGSFTPSGVFGLNVDWNWWSDPKLNTGGDNGHAMRWFQVRDREGNIVPGAYLVGHDYSGTSYANYDYNDNVYLVLNVKPHSGASAPKGLTAAGAAAGNVLNWTANREGDVVGYHVYRSTSAGGTYTRITSEAVTATIFTDTAAAVGQQTFYRVVAVNFYGREGSHTQASATRPTHDQPPGTPGTLAGTAASWSSVQLQWAAASGVVSGYRVMRAVGDGAFETVATVGADVLSHTDAGRSPLTPYRYQVVAFNNAGDSQPGNTLTVTTPADLTAPTNLLATAAAHDRVLLTWTDASQSETGFRIERAVGDGSFSVLTITPANATSFNDTGVSASTTYRYRVMAVRGDLAGQTSGVTSATTPASPDTLSPPTNLRPASVGAFAVTLAWDAAADNATGFRIERAVGDGAFVQVSNVNAGVTGWTDATVQPSTSYRYRVLAVGTGGVSDPSNVLAVATPADPSQVAPPSNLSATSPAATQVNLSWNHGGADLTGFVVERRAGDGGWMQIAVLGPGALSYVDLTAAPQTTYAYRVAAARGVYRSDWSAPATVTTPSANAFTGTAIGSATGSMTVLHPGADFDLSAAGGRVDGTNDSLWYVHRTVTGDFDVSVRLERLDKPHPAAVAGLMARDSLGADAANVFARSSGEVRLSYRAQAGGESSGVGTANPGVPVWLRLVRTGDVFTAYHSTTGTGWTPIGTANVPMAGTVYVGMAVASHADAPADARFREFGNFRAAPPAAPANFAAGPQGGLSVGLAWDDVSDNQAGFRVERRVVGADWQTLATLAEGSTGYTDTGVQSGVMYEYRVVAFNNAGEAASAVRGVTIRSDAPASPSDVRHDGGRGEGATLRWGNSSPDVMFFRVERRDVGGKWQTLTTVRASTVSLKDASVRPGQTYEYRVTAVGAGGESAPSNASQVATPATVRVEKPSLAATALGSSAVRLSWQDNGQGSRYVVQRRLPGGRWTDVATLAHGASQFVDRNLRPDSVYEYRVRAEADGMVGAWSEATSTATRGVAAWQSADVGTAGGSSRIVVAGMDGLRDVDVTAAGRDVWSFADELHLVYRKVVGDFDVAVRVTGLDGTDPERMAGLMVRSTLADDSRNVFVKVRPADVRMTLRSTASGQTSMAAKRDTAGGPQWVRLARVGDSVISYLSPDGRTWHEMARAPVALGSEVLVGLAASAHGNGTVEARFRDFTDLRARTPVPQQVRDLRATRADGLVGLRWTDPAVAGSFSESFAIERDDGDGHWKPIGFVGHGAAAYTDTDADAGRVYRYRVAASNHAGVGPFSLPASVRA